MTINSAFTTFPTLTTPRLHLSQIRLDDAAAVFEFKSNLEVTRRYGQEPHRSVEQTLGWIERLISGYARRESLFWAVSMKGEDRVIDGTEQPPAVIGEVAQHPAVIGGVTFWNFGEGMRCAELGYELHPAYWGRGLAAEACAAVLEFGFTEMELNRVEACPLAANDPSNKLLLNLGFRFEGILRQRVTFRGAFVDQLYYGLLRAEWRKPV